MPFAALLSSLLPLLPILLLAATNANNVVLFAKAQASSPTYDPSGGGVSDGYIGPEPTGIVTFGYLRMSFIDSPSILGGYYSTIYNANAVRDADDFIYRLNVTTIPCDSIDACMNISPEMEDTYIKPFLKAMEGYAAVFRPNYILSPRVVDHGEVTGTPIIEPTSVRLKTYEKGARHIINFERRITSELAHVFTYMQQTSNCAFTGILYEEFSELKSYIPHIQKMYTDGGLAPPPAVNYVTATPEEFVRLLEDRFRQCYILLLTYHTFVDVTARHIRGGHYFPEEANFFGTSLAAGGHFEVDGKSSMFKNLHFVRWSPLFKGSTMQAAVDARRLFGEWLSDPSVPAVERLENPQVGDGLLLSYLMMQFVIDALNRLKMENGVVIRTELRNRAIQGMGFNATMLNHILIDNDDSTNASSTTTTTSTFLVPIISGAVGWGLFLTVIYNNPHTIGDFPLLGRMADECPIRVLAQECFCNRATSTSYFYGVDGETGDTFEIYDADGQVGVGSTEFLTCATDSNSRSYPITSLLVRIPDNHVVTSGVALPELLVAQKMFDYFKWQTAAHNLAPVPPPALFGMLA